jgi:RNA polymerase sigma-70 factor (ECF subfamily)
LWETFGPSLRRLAYAYESRPDWREDLLQEIRLAIWTALPQFRGESSLRTFVFRIAHNRALTHIWQRRKTRRAEDPEDLLDIRANPEKSAIDSANESRLLEAISELPIPLRQVITLALEELPYAEIAAVLGISENNVAVRVNRGRKLLKEKLGGGR